MTGLEFLRLSTCLLPSFPANCFAYHLIILLCILLLLESSSPEDKLGETSADDLLFTCSNPAQDLNLVWTFKLMVLGELPEASLETNLSISTAHIKWPGPALGTVPVTCTGLVQAVYPGRPNPASDSQPYCSFLFVPVSLGPQLTFHSSYYYFMYVNLEIWVWDLVWPILRL